MPPAHPALASPCRNYPSLCAGELAPRNGSQHVHERVYRRKPMAMKQSNADNARIGNLTAILRYYTSTAPQVTDKKISTDYRWLQNGRYKHELIHSKKSISVHKSQYQHQYKYILHCGVPTTYFLRPGRLLRECSWCTARSKLHATPKICSHPLIRDDCNSLCLCPITYHAKWCLFMPPANGCHACCDVYRDARNIGQHKLPIQYIQYQCRSNKSSDDYDSVAMVYAKLHKHPLMEAACQYGVMQFFYSEADISKHFTTSYQCLKFLPMKMSAKKRMSRQQHLKQNGSKLITLTLILP